MDAVHVSFPTLDGFCTVPASATADVDTFLQTGALRSPLFSGLTIHRLQRRFSLSRFPTIDGVCAIPMLLRVLAGERIGPLVAAPFCVLRLLSFLHKPCTFSGVREHISNHQRFIFGCRKDWAPSRCLILRYDGSVGAPIHQSILAWAADVRLVGLDWTCGIQPASPFLSRFLFPLPFSAFFVMAAQKIPLPFPPFLLSSTHHPPRAVVSSTTVFPERPVTAAFVAAARWALGDAVGVGSGPRRLPGGVVVLGARRFCFFEG